MKSARFKFWRKSLAIFLLALIITPQFSNTVKAMDEPFYAGNDVLYYDPDAVQCATGAAGSGVNLDVDKEFNLGTDPKERRTNLAKALMKDYGLTAEQASGIVGNFMAESGGEHLPPDVNEGGSPGPPRFSGGYGWAQWTGPRQKAFIDFAVANGYMASRSVNATDAANYAWLKNELNTSQKVTIEKIKSATTPEDAAVSFEATFERAGVPRLDARKAGARKVFGELGGAAGGSSSSTSSACKSSGGAAIVGDKAFPLKTTKAAIDGKNSGMFKNNTASKGGHPYTAYDILIDPGTEVVAFLGGTVTMITEDRCPGRMVSIFSKESDLTVSYLHLNMSAGTHVKKGDTVTAGQHVGIVGPPAAGCGIPHLHIDAAKGDTRPGCSRLNCPAANASKFVDIGPDLFKTYEALP